MHFVCLAANYERTHNNDLTVHAKNIVVARDFHIGSVSLILAIFGGIRGSCYYLSKIWVSKRLSDLSKENMAANVSQEQNPAILTLISATPPATQVL